MSIHWQSKSRIYCTCWYIAYTRRTKYNSTSISSSSTTIAAKPVVAAPRALAIVMAAAIMNDEVLEERRATLSSEIITLWEDARGSNLYALLCPNGSNCPCLSEDEVPRLRISRCYFPGELDYFSVTQPFRQDYGFQVTWHCHVCLSEYSCGEGGLNPVAG